MLSGLPRIAFAAFVIGQAIVWSHSRYGPQHSPLALHSASHVLSKRSESVLPLLNIADEPEEVCAPLSYPVDQQCAHVLASCDASDTFLSIPYLQHYFCARPEVRPVIFAGLIVWLVFLFSTLGISASDFFCPNLASIADMLGLDESVAGVTFLAFGNGSPDLFSTFSAMRADSGSLAIGELLGAASFIVSVVAGSLCIIKPFKVDKKPFLRDVGFFTVAVALLLVILWDGRIHTWEAGILVGLYVLYVCVVVVGTWWGHRQHSKREHEAKIRGEYADDEDPGLIAFEPYHDDEDQATLQLPSPSPRVRAHSDPTAPTHLGIDTEHLSMHPHQSSRSPSPSPSHRMSQMPSFSLVGALEFRHVIAELQRQSSVSSLEVFDRSPLAPFAGGHYHTRTASTSSRKRSTRSTGRSARNSMYDSELDPWDAVLGQSMQLSHTRSPLLLNTNLPIGAPPGDHDGRATAPAAFPSLEEDGARTPDGPPRIATTLASPTSDMSLDDDDRTFVPPTRRQRVMGSFWHTMHVLFPTLHNLWSKSVLGIIASILAAPAVFALTVTLPVHVTQRHNPHASEKHVEGRTQDGRLVDFEEEGIERILTAEDEVEMDLHELKFNKWLTAVQLVLGSLFCVAVLFAGTDREIWLLLATSIASLVAAGLVLAFADRGDDRAAQMARCFMGFFVAVVWIMAIADEVVNVLKTFGFVFGLSDAIIGLTIFAVGNSLADFVADISVAAFAPAMGFAACFGGPMLNILLGVGLSSSYIIHVTKQPYHLHFSTTLFVSTVGLLTLLCATMVFVPLNGYFLPKKWGIFLVVGYVIIMIVNVVTEINKDNF